MNIILYIKPNILIKHIYNKKVPDWFVTKQVADPNADDTDP